HDVDRRSVLLHSRRIELRVWDELDVLQLVDLDLAVVDDTRPLAETRQLRDPAHDPAHVLLRLDEVHAAHAALAEDHRAFHPRGTGADHEHIVLRVRGGLEALWVPAAAILLAGGRV